MSGHGAAGSGEPTTDPATAVTVAVSETAKGDPSPRPGPIAARLGRYIILDLLGAGGMGLVYSAFDPQLDRRVAIKVLKAGVGTETDHQRLLREAKAMAKLTHPNVVAVYDAGDEAGQVYVAMEFVRGASLRRWLAANRSVDEILAVFVQAGHGLRAAHEIGMIHRDFKPDNVLLTEDGVAKVADFGLARGGEAPALEAPVLGDVDTVLSSRELLTRDGMLVGTPAYMSPEQFLGIAVDASSDQFSFFVALYEALYGELPFEGETIPVLAANVTSGHRRPRPQAGSVPRWLAEVVDRGLQSRKVERWRSMDEALAALGRDPSARRRGRNLFLLGGSIVLAATISGYLLGRMSDIDEVQKCMAAASLDGIWDDESRTKVRTAILATELPYAPQTWRGVEGELDRYADAWVRMHNEACAATTIRGEQSAELLDLRMACLRRHLGALAAHVEVLARADAPAVESALAAVQRLPPLSACADPVALRSADDLVNDPARARQSAPLRERLARALAEHNAAHHEVARELASKVLADARDLALWEVAAEAEIAAARSAAQLADYAGAQVSLESAFTTALAHGDDLQAAEAAIEGIFVVGYYQGEYDEGARWGRIALALLDRSGEVGSLRALYYNYTGALLQERGATEEALRHHEAGLEILERIEVEPLRVAAQLNNLGVAYQESGRLVDAKATFARALELLTAAHGHEHPHVAATIENLGTVYLEEGDHAAACANDRASLEIRRKVLPAGHPRIAISMINLASAELERGAAAVAQELAEGSLAILREALGDAHISVAFARSVLADALLAAEELAAAREQVTAALAIYRAELDGGHGYLALPLVILAEIDERSGDLEAAGREIAEVAAIADEDPTASPADIGRIRFTAARIHWLRGALSEAATDLRAAEAAYERAGPTYEPQRIAIAAWRAEHEGLR